MCHKTKITWVRERGRSVREADLCERGHVRERPCDLCIDWILVIDRPLSHMASLTKSASFASPMWSVRERPICLLISQIGLSRTDQCDYWLLISDWMREITWVSGRGRLWKRPILWERPWDQWPLSQSDGLSRKIGLSHQVMWLIIGYWLDNSWNRPLSSSASLTKSAISNSWQQ